MRTAPMMTEKQIRILMALYEKQWRNEKLSETLQNEYFLRYSTLEQVLGEAENAVTSAVRVATQYKNDNSLREVLKEVEEVEKIEDIEKRMKRNE
jgi:hypothetical protein